MPRLRRQDAEYIVLLGAAFVFALVASWTSLAAQINNDGYDLMFRIYRPPAWEPQSALLAIDEQSLSAFGGLRHLRDDVADALERLADVSPKVVAIDVILPDDGDPAADARLEQAIRNTPHVVLACDLLPEEKGWEDPLPRFRRWAAAAGHVHGQPDELDGISREVPLEKASGNQRRWSLALEAFRVSRQAEIVESPKDLQLGGVRIPATRASARSMRVRYIPPGMPPIPRVSLNQLHDSPGIATQFSGKVVFVGVTAQAVGDRPMTPYSNSMVVPGVEILASAFETIAQRQFLTNAPEMWVIAFGALLVAAAGVAFAYFPGWQANAAAALILAIAHFTPYFLFTRRIVFPLSTPVACAWFSVVAAAAYQHFVVRRRLRKSEAERGRYQQAMHFVTHEMRTPLTAIQGSSELISRYAMPDEKRNQIAQLITSESKRLGRMIETFLNVERLSAGQMELKKEDFSAWDLMIKCIERVRPLAGRKQIQIATASAPGDAISGDRELMEYAFYNLLTNAVKYSPPHTQVTVYGRRDGEHIQIAVQDQGIGMDQKEVRKIFQKFYRTRRAEESGEAGTGIGLSIVEQIVTQHGGRIDVVSRPGRGSCFTVVLPAAVSSHATTTRS